MAVVNVSTLVVGCDCMNYATPIGTCYACGNLRYVEGVVVVIEDPVPPMPTMWKIAAKLGGLSSDEYFETQKKMAEFEARTRELESEANALKLKTETYRKQLLALAAQPGMAVDLLEPPRLSWWQRRRARKG